MYLYMDPALGWKTLPKLAGVGISVLRYAGGFARDGLVPWPCICLPDVHLVCTLHAYLCCILKVKSWVKELRKMLGQDISLCIVGNKIDLEKDRHVSMEEAERWGGTALIIKCLEKLKYSKQNRACKSPGLPRPQCSTYCHLHKHTLLLYCCKIWHLLRKNKSGGAQNDPRDS